MNTPLLHRRRFLQQSALAATGTALSLSASKAFSREAGSKEKLKIGIIGAGGRGSDNLKGVEHEQIIAMCDVDDAHAAKSFERFPAAKRYRDFRVMLEKEKELEAVVVSTPDHTHAIASITAMRLGKHVYCEKPLARSIHEVRRMREVAAETGVVTQMGQQGHAFEGSRRAVEVIRSGAIGEVTELHVWSDRPKGWWPQGVERPTETPPVPKTLDWELWLGPAPQRPYHPVYVPFKWRGFWDFGTGAIGDMGVHNLDTAYWALELGLPTSAEIKDSSPKFKETPPAWSIVQLAFPARNARPPVSLTWYDGGKLPPGDLFHGEKVEDNGSLVVGTKGTLYTRSWHGGQSESDMFLLLPRKQFADFKAPAPVLPRVESTYAEWISACKGGPKTLSNFAYASTLTESLLIANLALRAGKRIEWDAGAMRAKNCPEADAFIRPEFRAGWSI